MPLSIGASRLMPLVPVPPPLISPRATSSSLLSSASAAAAATSISPLGELDHSSLLARRRGSARSRCCCRASSGRGRRHRCRPRTARTATWSAGPPGRLGLLHLRLPFSLPLAFAAALRSSASRSISSVTRASSLPSSARAGAGHLFQADVAVGVLLHRRPVEHDAALLVLADLDVAVGGDVERDDAHLAVARPDADLALALELGRLGRARLGRGRVGLIDHLHVAVGADLEFEVAAVGDEAHVAVAAGLRRRRLGGRRLGAGLLAARRAGWRWPTCRASRCRWPPRRCRRAAGRSRRCCCSASSSPLGGSGRVAALGLGGLAEGQLGVAAAAEAAGQLIDGRGDVADAAAAVAVLADLVLVEQLLGLVGGDAQEFGGLSSV